MTRITILADTVRDAMRALNDAIDAIDSAHEQATPRSKLHTTLACAATDVRKIRHDLDDAARDLPMRG